MVAGAWQTEGTLAAQRVMVDLVMPVGFAWMCALFAAIALLKRKRFAASLLALGTFALIGILFNPMLSRRLMRSVEAPTLNVSPLSAEAPSYRAAIVLGGGTVLSSDGTAQLSSDGHRIAMAAQMWHAGKVQAIICTGDDNFVPQELSVDGKISLDRDLFNPARQGIEILKSLDVPEDRLFRVRGINTIAEMKNLAAFLKSPPESFPQDGEIALITSAFHIPRAMRLAGTERLVFTPIPVCYRTGPPEPLALIDFVPNVDAGQRFYLAFKEILAQVVGR